MNENKVENTVYRVVMHVEPAIAIGQAMKDVVSDIEIEIEELDHSEMKTPRGLRLVLTLKSDTAENAISRARGIPNRILSLFAFLRRVSLPETLPVKCYDVTSGRQEGLFIQYDYDVPMDKVSVRRIDRKDLRTSFRSISKLEEDNRNRVFRAFHWYSLALRSRDVFDIFTSLWIGLETINPLVRDYYGLAVEHSQCTNCGHKTAPTLNGIRKLLRESSGEGNIWARARKLRVGTMHGFRAFWKLIPEARKLVPILRDALDRRLRTILKIGYPSSLNPLDMAHPRPAYCRTTAIIQGPILSVVDRDVVPGIDLRIASMGKEAGRQGFRVEEKMKSITSRGFHLSGIEHSFHLGEQVGKYFKTFPPDLSSE